MNQTEADEEDFGPSLGIAGAVNIDVGLTINIQNFQSLKINIGLNEPYSGINGDTREAKIEELFDFIQKKLDDKAVALSIHNKQLVNIIEQAIKDLE